MLDLKKIGEKLQDYRKKANLSQDDLANKLYVTHQAISRWETGKALPSLDNIFELIKLYQTSVEELLCLRVNPKTSLDHLFSEYSRSYAIDAVLKGKFDNIHLEDIIHRLDGEERRYVIHQIIHRLYPCSPLTLWPRLSYEERRQLLVAYVKGQYALPIQELSPYMSPLEVKWLEERKKI